MHVSLDQQGNRLGSRGQDSVANLEAPKCEQSQALVDPMANHRH